MELILINSGKLKIMLTDDEMKKYDLDTDTIDYDTTSTRRAFWSILDDAKTQTGFDAASDRVFIQLYPSRDGGAEMYITRLTTPEQSTHTDAAVKITGVYKFASLSLMLEACSKIRPEIMPGASSAWSTNMEYYLITEECLSYKEFVDGKSRGGLGEMLGAYSKVMTSPIIVAHVKEHCECMVERDAVEVLSKLA